MWGGASFISIATYRIAYPACCGLADPDVATELLSAASRVDSLDGYTAAMWSVLTDVVLEEWFGIRLPPSKVPWMGPVCLPNDCRLLYCLDRTYARQVRADVDRHYLSLNRGVNALSFFAGYGLVIPNDMECERNGFVFLARQAEHFRSSDDYLFIVEDA